MGTTATAGSGTTYKPAPAGNHVAVCVGVIDLGTQEKVYEGKSSWKPTICLLWELSDEMREDGKPFTLSRNFTLSLHESSALRPFLQGWRGRAFTEPELQKFDCEKLLGQPCMLNVVHVPGKNGKTYANVTAATPLPRRIQAPEPTGDLFHYSTDDGPPPDSLPQWLRDRIMQCQEFKGKAQAEKPDEVPPSTGDPNFEEWDEEQPRF